MPKSPAKSHGLQIALLLWLGWFVVDSKSTSTELSEQVITDCKASLVKDKISVFLVTIIEESRDERERLLVQIREETATISRLSVQISLLTARLNEQIGINANLRDALKRCNGTEAVAVSTPSERLSSNTTLVGHPTIETITTCENSVQNIACSGANKTIRIIDANYGRTESAVVCPHPMIQTTSCFSANSKSIVVSRCENKTSCAVPASNSIFGDPCVNTYKYLKVHYECI